MSVSLTSKYACPACGLLLRMQRQQFLGDAAVTLWCGNPRCPSAAADNGAMASTEDDAWAKLEAAMNAEPVLPDEREPKTVGELRDEAQARLGDYLHDRRKGEL